MRLGRNHALLSNTHEARPQPRSCFQIMCCTQLCSLMHRLELILPRKGDRGWGEHGRPSVGGARTVSVSQGKSVCRRHQHVAV